jgi:predicted HTH transcriptional regulator
MASAHPEEHLPSAYIQAVCYRGKERNADEQLDARDISGPLDFQMARACGLSRTSIANWIKRSQGSIRRVGFDNGGFWQVIE